MHVLLFEKRFWQPIRTGQKVHTIRAARKRPIQPSDELSLRGWRGAAYRSTQRILTTKTCWSVRTIEIDVDRVADDGESLRDAHDRSADSLGWDRPNRVGNRDTKRHVTSLEHRGWQPGCQCDPVQAPAPCRVLDPFAGTGTTLMVAKQMGCEASGIEINPTYAELIERRGKKMFGMFAGVRR